MSDVRSQRGFKFLKMRYYIRFLGWYVKSKKMSKNPHDNVYFGGHLGFGGHFESLITLKRYK